MTGLADIQRYLQRMDYPSDRRMLVEAALSYGAPEALIDVLGRLPDRQYRTVADVNRAIGDIE